MTIEEELDIIEESLDPQIRKGLCDEIASALHELFVDVDIDIRSLSSNISDKLYDVYESHVSVISLENSVTALKSFLKSLINSDYFGHEEYRFITKYADFYDLGQIELKVIQDISNRVKLKFYEIAVDVIAGLLGSCGRDKLFERFKFENGYQWTEFATQKSMNYLIITNLISQKFEGIISQQSVEESINHLEYKKPWNGVYGPDGEKYDPDKRSEILFASPADIKRYGRKIG